MAFDVISVSSSQDALAVVRDGERSGTPIDLAFVDWQMAGASGLDAVRALRAGPGGSALPVVLVTAYARDEIVASARDVGVETLLVKPISASSLYEVVLRLLGGPWLAEPADGTVRLEPRRFAEGARILLVEDNPLNREVAVDMLQATGAKVVVAANGNEALELVGREVFDLILMDVQMPGMNGLEATRSIRALGAAGTMPILALTASSMPGDRERCLAAGMVDYLVKPVDPPAFLAALERWIPPVEFRRVRRRSSSAQLAAVALPAATRSSTPMAAWIGPLDELLRGGSYEAAARVAAAGPELDAWLGPRALAFHAAMRAFDFELASGLLTGVSTPSLTTKES